MAAARWCSNPGPSGAAVLAGQRLGPSLEAAWRYHRIKQRWLDALLTIHAGPWLELLISAGIAVERDATVAERALTAKGRAHAASAKQQQAGVERDS